MEGITRRACWDGLAISASSISKVEVCIEHLLAFLVSMWGIVYEGKVCGKVNGHEHRTRVGMKKLHSHTEQNSQTEGAIGEREERKTRKDYFLVFV